MAAKKKFVIVGQYFTGTDIDVRGYSDSYARACIKMAERIRWDSVAVYDTETGDRVAGQLRDRE